MQKQSENESIVASESVSPRRQITTKPVLMNAIFVSLQVFKPFSRDAFSQCSKSRDKIMQIYRVFPRFYFTNHIICINSADEFLRLGSRNKNS